MGLTALIVCAARAEGAEDTVRRLAHEVDVVIAVDGGAHTCEDASVRPSVVVGDLDSLDSDTAERLRASGVEFQVFPVLKDETDLELALNEVRQRGVTEVVVTGAFSGRLDHTLAAVGSLMRAADLRPRIEEPDQSGWLLSALHKASARVTPEGATFSAISLGTASVISVEGAQWPLHQHRLDGLSSFGVSNTVVGGAATVTVHSGTVLVMVPRLGL